MEDYIRGVLCGYLQVQNGTRENVKRKRTFVVLSDSRLDYYLADPRPAFTAKIDATYFLTDSTRVHHYVELNSRAPPHSICLTTDKATDVYVADTQEEADLWFRHLSERLQALAQMLKGFLMLRKELSVDQQIKRFVLGTKYRWKARHVELGRSALRFCKPSDHKTKIMKQFALTASSFAGQESTTYLRHLSLLASYSIPVNPTPQMLKSIKKNEKTLRDKEERNEVDNSDTSINEVQRKGSRVAAFYPFLVVTGQAFIHLAAPTEQIRTHWILAIRLRIIALKYRHQNGASPRKQPLVQESNPCHLQSFVEAQVKPGRPWKRCYVELDNGLLRVKKSERKLGSILEMPIIPTCHVTPLLEKANAFTVRSLGCEVAFAPGCASEARRWMNLLTNAAAAVHRTRYQRIFHEDIQKLLHHSVIYAVDVASDTMAGIVLEKHKRRIFVLSHEPPPRSPRRGTMTGIARRLSILTAATSSDAALPAMATPDLAGAAIVPDGSVLVGISQFGMMHDSADTIWHALRTKKGCYKQAKRLLFRAPAVREGVLRVKFRAADCWVLHRCRLANGAFCVEDGQHGNVLAKVALRDCEVELFSDDDCGNGIKLVRVTGNASVVFMNVAVDHDAFLWFAMLHMEISVAQNSPTFPLIATKFAGVPLGAPASSTSSTREDKLAADQAKGYRDCSVVDMRVEEIETSAREHEKALLGHTAGARKSKMQEADSLFNSLQPTEHLDAVGSGEVSLAQLVFTMKLITRHIRSRRKIHRPFNLEVGERELDSDPLHDFFAALETFKADGRNSLTPEDFASVMDKVIHSAIVELVRKELHNDIQCI